MDTSVDMTRFRHVAETLIDIEAGRSVGQGRNWQPQPY